MSGRLSSKCQLILKKGVGGRCGTKGIREYVGCRAQQLRKGKGKKSWGPSMKQAWSEARRRCKR